MSMIQIVSLSAVVGAFVVFAAVLAWGDYRSRHLVQNSRQQGAGFETLKKAAVEATVETEPQSGPIISAM